MPDQSTAAEPKISPEEFASKIKAKYPAYANVSNAELTHRFIAKYPVYKERVDWGAAAPAGMTGATVSTGRVGPESAAGKFMSAAQPKLAAAAPAVGGTIGAVAGGLVAGPPGAVVGAAYGGGVGEAAREKQMGEKSSLGHQVGEAALQGGMEFVGGTVAPRVLGKIGSMAAKSIDADSKMAKLLGLKITKRGVNSKEAAEQITSLVNKEVKGYKDLGELQAKVTQVKEGYNQATDSLINTHSLTSRSIPWTNIVYRNGVNAIQEAEAFNRPTKAIDELVDMLDKKITTPHAAPKDLLDIRRTLLRETDPASGQAMWPAGTKQFRTMLYHDINREIKDALPAQAAREFSTNNSKVSRLIHAENAIKAKNAKLFTGQIKPEESAAAEFGSKVVGAAKHSLPAIGAYEGYRQHHSVTGAVAGAAIGYGASKAIGSTAARAAVARVAPKLAAAAKHSPQAARALQALTEVQSVNNRPDK